MQFSEATARAAGLRIVRVTKFKVATSRQRVPRPSLADPSIAPSGTRRLTPSQFVTTA